ncbi:hypothetical protein [unidentified bacterial endosymbiont]|uniref:hypothetical protein n=1 Tax=unidentified bacterial endosymbiont TaxID=2355 RepID=UPI0020A04D95|nr:hypothetical protein [unidentified bacterial endosymbiont]
MHLLTKYLFGLRKYLSLLSKNCGAALTTFLENTGKEPVYEEISHSDGLIDNETLNADYEEPLTFEEPIYEEIRHSDEPIYMEMNRSQSTLNSNRDAPIREADLNSTEAIYMDMDRGRSQPIQLSKDDPSEILNALLQLMTTINLHRVNFLSTEVPDEVNIGSKQSTKTPARIEVSLRIDLNNPQCFGLSCH